MHDGGFSQRVRLSARIPPAMLASMSALLRWCVTHHPDRTHCAGALVFLDLSLAVEVIDRAESAGVSIERVRGFAVVDGVATPVPGQHLDLGNVPLLDCETPSGASCGRARRTLRSGWAGDAPANGRHVVLLDVDDLDVGSLDVDEPA